MPGNPFVVIASPMTVGMKLRSDVAGTIKGIRFYKGAGNTGTHIGMLYSSSGTLLAEASFSSETASGWQEADFAAPVTIAANTTYVAAYFTTVGCAYDPGYFAGKGVDNAPLHALQSGVDGLNGVYVYSNSPQFPAQSYSDANYWVDVAFTASGGTPAPGGGATIWSGSATPGNASVSIASPMTVGVKFRSDVAGAIKGIRFYKGAGNSGTHVAMLYSGTGALLAQATFSSETAVGWQEADFTTPIAIAANTTYVAAYFTTVGCAYDPGYFAGKGVDNAPLHALQSGVDGFNGVYVYSNSPQLPAQSYGDANYWVDVAFTAN
jgi:hypothetical protein